MDERQKKVQLTLQVSHQSLTNSDLPCEKRKNGYGCEAYPYVAMVTRRDVMTAEAKSRAFETTMTLQTLNLRHHPQS